MEIQFDPAKDESNLKTHGIRLADAGFIEWEGFVSWPDNRKDYGEPRRYGIGYIGDRLYYLAYVMRGDVLRAISLRKANKREIAVYAKT